MRSRDNREVHQDRASSASILVLGKLTGTSWRFYILTGVLVGFVGFVIALVGIDSMADGSAGQQGLEATLQQMIAEQQAQRAQMQDLAQAVHGAQRGLQMTQTVTEAVVQQVVGQAQASFAQEQQRQQDNLDKLRRPTNRPKIN